MKMKMEKGWIYIVDVDNLQGSVLKSWTQLIRWNRERMQWQGRVCLELLDKLSQFLRPMNKRLPGSIEEEREKLRAIQEAVDAERVKPDGEVYLMVKPPIKAKLFKHQQRALNMCLMTFGLVDPPGKEGTS